VNRVNTVRDTVRDRVRDREKHIRASRFEKPRFVRRLDCPVNYAIHRSGAIRHASGPLDDKLLGAYSDDVNRVFRRDVNRHSGDVNKVGAQRRWDCNHA